MIYKKIILLIVFTTSLFCDVFKENVAYKTLREPIMGLENKNSIIKVYSITCPFCYKYDKYVMEDVIKKINNVKYSDRYLCTKDKYGIQMMNLLAVAKIRDIKSNKNIFSENSFYKRIKFSYYEMYFEKNERWNKGEDEFYKKGFEILKTDKESFLREMENISVKKLIKEWKNTTYKIAKIQGIPAILVNSKYIVITRNIKSKKYLVDLLKYLLDKK